MQFLQIDNLPPQVLFLSSIILQNFIQNSWDLIESKKIEFLMSLLIKVINENFSITNSSHIFRLILILCDIILLNFDYIEIVSQLNPILLPKFFSNLYEIFNDEEPFLSRWGVLPIANNNLEKQFPFALQLLHQFDPYPDWFDLHYQLLRFSQDFSYFYPFLEKIQNDVSAMSFPDHLLKLIQYILSNDMEESSPADQLYFKSIIEIVLSISNFLISNKSNFSDESVYMYVIYLWDSIFSINEFFVSNNHSDFLNAIVNQYLSSIPQLIQDSTTFTDSLNNFSDFLSSNADSQILTEPIIFYLNFLSALIDSNDMFFKDHSIVNCVLIIQQGFEEIFADYVSAIIGQNRDSPTFPESFFFILASTEPDFSRTFSEFASIKLIQTFSEQEVSNLSVKCSAETALFFIRKVGVLVVKDDVVKQLISIVFKLFEKDANGAATTIRDFASKMPNILSLFYREIMALAGSGQLRRNESSCLVVSLYSLSSSLVSEATVYNEILEFILVYISHYLHSIIPLFESREIFCHLNDFLYFLVTLLPESTNSVPVEFKNSLFNFISSSLQPFLLVDDEETQHYLCQLFELFFRLSFISNIEQEMIVADWLEKVIPVQKNSIHFNLLEFVIGDFQFPSILSFVFSLREDEEENTRILPCIIESFVHPLFLRQRSYFVSVFSQQFLVSFLTISANIVALNCSFDLFIDFFNSPDFVTADLAVLTLNTLFQSMINNNCYHRKQIECSLKIIHLIIDNKILKGDAVIGIFLSFFDVQIPGINELISFFVGSKNDGLDNDIIETEYNLLNFAITFIRNQVI